jgi:hypothetical protein
VPAFRGNAGVTGWDWGSRMTPMRASCFALAMMLGFATPATAAEIWHCTAGAITKYPHAIRNSTARIEGDFLNWVVFESVMGTDGNPKQLPNGEIQQIALALPCRIIRNNESGVVAINAGSPANFPDGVPLISADVLLISKSDGHYRFVNGEAAAFGIEDGHCTLDQEPKAP